MPQSKIRGYSKEIEKAYIEKTDCVCCASKKYECCQGCPRIIRKMKARDEMDARGFSDVDKKRLDSLWVNDEVGFLGKKGCMLPRRLRPWNCLIFYCNKKRQK